MDYEKRYVKYGGSPNLRFFLASGNKELNKKH